MNISKEALTLMKGQLHVGLYPLVGTASTGLVAIAENKENEIAKLWHLRLGHVSERGLYELNLQEYLRMTS